MDKVYAICYTYGGPYKNIARIEDMVYTTKESCISRLNEIKNALSQLIAVKNGSVYYTVDEENLSVIETWKDSKGSNISAFAKEMYVASTSSSTKSESNNSHEEGQYIVRKSHDLSGYLDFNDFMFYNKGSLAHDIDEHFSSWDNALSHLYELATKYNDNIPTDPVEKKIRFMYRSFIPTKYMVDAKDGILYAPCWADFAGSDSHKFKIYAAWIEKE